MLRSILFLTLTSCTTTEILRPDSSKSAIDYNYHVALLNVSPCSKKSVGVNFCKAPRNGGFALEVLGVYRGRIDVASKNCQFEQSKYYVGTRFVRFDIPYKGFDKCLFSVFVDPEFADEELDGVVYAGLKGVLLIRFDESVLGASQNYESKIFNLTVPQKFVGGLIQMDSCGARLIGEHITQSTLPVELQTLPNGICVLDGLITKPSLGVYGFSYLLSVIDKNYDSLPLPLIRIKKDRVYFHAPYQVSLVSMNESAVFSREGSFDYKDNSVMAFYATSGRVVYCFLKDRGVECLH